jgi:hypothetical protein
MAIYQEKTQMTQRPLTATELADARTAYNTIGRTRWLADTYTLNTLLVRYADAIDHKTTDGKPLRTERVPTAADIGKRVRWKLLESDTGWTTGYVFCGFTLEGRPVVQKGTFLHAVEVCIIDEDAAQ